MPAMEGPEEGAPVEDLMRDAIARFEAWGAAPYRARAEGELGVWLAKHGSSEEASVLLVSARQTLAGLGAHAWAAALEDALLAPAESVPGERPHTGV